jgi:hypothetical protein
LSTRRIKPSKLRGHRERTDHATTGTGCHRERDAGSSR